MNQTNQPPEERELLELEIEKLRLEILKAQLEQQQQNARSESLYARIKPLLPYLNLLLTRLPLGQRYTKILTLSGLAWKLWQNHSNNKKN